MGSKHEDVPEVAGIEDVELTQKDPKGATAAALINQDDQEIYLEALDRYPVRESIDRAAEKRLIRKLDMQILPLLGICYFFYVRELIHQGWILACSSANPRYFCLLVCRQNNPLIRGNLWHQRLVEPPG